MSISMQVCVFRAGLKTTSSSHHTRPFRRKVMKKHRQCSLSLAAHAETHRPVPYRQGCHLYLHTFISFQVQILPVRFLITFQLILTFKYIYTGLKIYFLKLKTKIRIKNTESVFIKSLIICCLHPWLTPRGLTGPP